MAQPAAEGQRGGEGRASPVQRAGMACSSLAAKATRWRCSTAALVALGGRVEFRTVAREALL
jgi:hypothetical protein